MNNWQWRDYQNECFEAIIDKYHAGINKQLLVQATGLGKRSQAVFMAGKARNSLFLAHTEELISQAYNDFVKWYGFENVGIIHGKYMDLDKRFVVSSPQTLYNRLNKIPYNHFQMIQLDEVHRYMAKTYYQVVNYFDVQLRLGWTATPRRLDGLSLMDLFQEKTFEYGILKGIQEGYLAELKGIRIKTNINLSGARKSMGDFNVADLENLVDIPERNKLIVDSYEKYANQRQFISFAVDTAHAVNISKEFAERGHNVAVISSDSSVCPDREGRILSFRRGELKGLINVNILTEGFDYRDVGAVLDAAPTLSESRYLQRIGRGTRIKSERFQQQFGNNCLVLDFVDISNRHKIVNSFELDKSLPALEKVFVDSKDRTKLKEAEDKRKIKVIHLTENDEYFDFAAPPQIKGSKSPRMMEEATEAQIKLLKWLDLYTEKDEEGNLIEYTKQTVADLLKSEIAPWMKRRMIEWKYNPTGATMDQYLAIAKMKKLEAEEEATRQLREDNTRKILDGLKHDRGYVIPTDKFDPQTVHDSIDISGEPF